jgi:hypothetical protein
MSFKIVFDIDGTLIGDIRPQLVLYELYNALKEKGDNKSANLFLKPSVFKEKLERGIIRPHVTYFINKMLQLHKDNVDFYIYTASEKTWAQFLIPHLEKCLGIKFKRPLLTRDNCIDMYKKVSTVYDCISKKSIVDEEKILIIDNNSTVYGNDQRHVLICNTYDTCKLENLLCYIDENMYEQHKETIIHVLSKYIPELKTSVDFYQFQKRYYVYYLKNLQDAQKRNALHSKDKFFLNLTNIILYKNIKTYNDKTIRYLNKKLES